LTAAGFAFSGDPQPVIVKKIQLMKQRKTVFFIREKPVRECLSGKIVFALRELFAFN